MRRFAISMISVLIVGSALAQENQPRREGSQESVRTAIEKSSEPSAAEQRAAQAQQALRRAMNEEIANQNTVTRERVASLVARLETTVSSQDRLDVQRLISTAKEKGWRDILAIQLKYAERGGHLEQAEDLRTRIARLDEKPSRDQAATPTASRTTRPSKRAVGGTK